MINHERFERALAVGMLPLFVMVCVYAMTPTGALSLAGDTSSPGARLSGTQLVIDGLGLYGSTVEGVEVTHFDLGELEQLSNLIIERDFRPSSVIPGAPSWTLHMEIPYVSAPQTMDIYASNTCMSGIGITNFGLFEGLVDPFLNDAVSNGHHPNLLTFLINIIGPAGIINFTVRDFKSEVLVLDAGRLQTSGGLQVEITPHQVDSAFHGTCL